MQQQSTVLVVTVVLVVVVVLTVVVLFVLVLVVSLQSRTATGERKMPVVDQNATPHVAK